MVFLLSLRSLKNFIEKNKIKIDAGSCRQLSADINWIVTSIVTSDIVEASPPDLKDSFQRKLLNLQELSKWKKLISLMADQVSPRAEEPSEQRPSDLLFSNMYHNKIVFRHPELINKQHSSRSNQSIDRYKSNTNNDYQMQTQIDTQDIVRQSIGMQLQDLATLVDEKILIHRYTSRMKNYS